MFEIYVLAYQMGIQIFRWSAEKANYITSVNFYSRLHCIRMGYSLSPQKPETDLDFNFVENCSLAAFKAKR